MENYKITVDGRLLHELIHLEDRSDPQYPTGSIERLAGSATRIHDGWRDVHFHGIIHFYGDKHSGETRLISFAPETLGRDLERALAAVDSTGLLRVVRADDADRAVVEAHEEFLMSGISIRDAFGEDRMRTPRSLTESAVHSMQSRWMWAAWMR